jgi:hypothetical protein
MSLTIQEEVSRNYEAFTASLLELLATHRGQHALIRHQKIVGFFDTGRDAYTAGRLLFASDQLFSIQEVAHNPPANMGFWSYALSHGDV